MISRSQQSRPRLFFASLVFLLVFILSGCILDTDTSSSPGPDSQDQDGNNNQQDQNDTASSDTSNHQPTAKITAPQASISGQTVTLNGSGSDPDGDILSFKWAQVKGPSIVLSNTSSSNLTFVAPVVSRSTQFTFELTVHDGELSNSTSVSMQISPMEDNTSPLIVSRSPQPDQSRVAPNAEIRVVFDEALLESSVDNQSFLVSQAGNPVSGAVSYDSSSYTIAYKPTSDLSAGATYTVTLASTIQDISNNTFAGASWSFSTAAGSVVTDGRCATAEDNNSLMLSCPSGEVITAVEFASYGNPSGECGSFTAGSCNASNSVAAVSKACKGKNSCTLYAGSETFGGDPCEEADKKLAAQVACGKATDAGSDTNSDSSCDMSELVAFPCAEGYGKVATGGRGGDVYEVTTLNASGPGSLGEAVSASGPRTVVFRVSGYIKGDINISNDDITIAGQTAPGDGIAINGRLTVAANNTIIRYLRVRGVANEDTITNAHNSPSRAQIYDHLSASWSSDEIFSVYFNEDITIQYCMITEAASGGHKFGGIWGGNHNSYHHNLFAHNTSRNPRIASGSGFNDFRNNVMFNTSQPIHGGEKHQVGDPLHVFQSSNVVANYIKPGPVNPGINICNPGSRDGTNDAGSWYVADNVLHGNADVTANNWEGVSGTYIKLDEPSEYMPIRQQTAEEAFETVLEKAGCSMPKRDSMDARIIEEARSGEVQNGNGLVSSPGPLPELQGGQAPADSDHDGMPDAWETANGLDPNDASDRNNTTSIGYTMLEVYLNSLDDF